MQVVGVPYTKFYDLVAKTLKGNDIEINGIYKLDSITNISENKRYILYAVDGELKMIELEPNKIGNIIKFESNNSIDKIIVQLPKPVCVLEKAQNETFNVYVKDFLEGIHLRGLLSRD